MENHRAQDDIAKQLRGGIMRWMHGTKCEREWGIIWDPRSNSFFMADADRIDWLAIKRRGGKCLAIIRYGDKDPDRYSFDEALKMLHDGGCTECAD